MKKKILAVTLVLLLFLSTGNVFALTGTASTPNPEVNTSETTSVVTEDEITNEAGVLPDSNFYRLERAVEELQIAITQSEEKLAKLLAEFGTERAAEAVVMVNQGNEELAGQATAEYIEMLSSAAAHIENAIKAKDKAVVTVENLNEAYKKSEDILKTILTKVPDESKAAIEKALENQDKEIAAVNGFYAAKDAFFAVKEEFQKAKKELEAARKSGDLEAIKIAEQKVAEAEALKNELEALKDAADASKEEVKHLVEQAEKRIEQGFKQIEKANEKMDEVQEKALEESKKIEEKSREEMKRAEEKAREEAKKTEEKAREAAKRTEERAREELKRAGE